MQPDTLGRFPLSEAARKQTKCLCPCWLEFSGAVLFQGSCDEGRDGTGSSRPLLSIVWRGEAGQDRGRVVEGVVETMSPKRWLQWMMREPWVFGKQLVRPGEERTQRQLQRALKHTFIPYCPVSDIPWPRLQSFRIAATHLHILLSIIALFRCDRTGWQEEMWVFKPHVPPRDRWGAESSCGPRDNLLCVCWSRRTVCSLQEILPQSKGRMYIFGWASPLILNHSTCFSQAMWTLPSLQFPLENYLEHAACDSSLPVRVEADSEQLAGSIEWTQFSVCAISKITWLFLTCPCGESQEVGGTAGFPGPLLLSTAHSKQPLFFRGQCDLLRIPACRALSVVSPRAPHLLLPLYVYSEKITRGSTCRLWVLRFTKNFSVFYLKTAPSCFEYYFYVSIILNLQRSCRKTTKSMRVPLIQFALLLKFCVATICFSKLINWW